MVAPNHNRGFQAAVAHHFVERQSQFVADAQTDPADARRQPLKGDPFPRHIQPVVQVAVLGQQLFDLLIGLVDILRIPRKRRPAERPDATTKQRSDIGGHKPWEVKGIFQSFVQCHLANIIAVIQRWHSGVPEIKHRRHLYFHAGARCFFDSFGCVFSPFSPLCYAPSLWQIAIGWVVGTGLVGHDVGVDAASDQFGKYIGGIAQQPHRSRFAGFGPARDHLEGLVESICPLINVFCTQSKINAVGIAFNGQTTGPGHHCGQRLCATHTPQTAGENPFALEVAVIMLPTRFDEGFIGALYDALAADIDP